MARTGHDVMSSRALSTVLNGDCEVFDDGTVIESVSLWSAMSPSRMVWVGLPPTDTSPGRNMPKNASGKAALRAAFSSGGNVRELSAVHKSFSSVIVMACRRSQQGRSRRAPASNFRIRKSEVGSTNPQMRWPYAMAEQ